MILTRRALLLTLAVAPLARPRRRTQPLTTETGLTLTTETGVVLTTE